MDTGSAIKGKYRFDFAVFDKNFANKLGANYWDVYLVKMGNGKLKTSLYKKAPKRSAYWHFFFYDFLICDFLLFY